MQTPKWIFLMENHGNSNSNPEMRPSKGALFEIKIKMGNEEQEKHPIQNKQNKMMLIGFDGISDAQISQIDFSLSAKGNQEENERKRKR
jgi:hypothetical protein